MFNFQDIPFRIRFMSFISIISLSNNNAQYFWNGCVTHLFEQRATNGHTMDVRGGENPLQTTTFDVILLLTKNEPTLLVPKTACVQLVCQILVKPKRVRLMEGFHPILYTAFLYGQNCWNIPEITLTHWTSNQVLANNSSNWNQ